MADFAIAGGGIAGLVLARRLALGGRSVTLHEASDQLGGTVGQHRVGDLDLDSGAESFAVYGGVVAALAVDLGLETEAPATRGAWLLPPTGDARPLPATGVFGIPGHPLAADVRAVLGLGGSLRAAVDAVLPAKPLAVDATIGALVRERMGRRALERLVAPVVHGVYSLDPNDLAVDTAVPRSLRQCARCGPRYRPDRPLPEFAVVCTSWLSRSLESSRTSALTCASATRLTLLALG